MTSIIKVDNIQDQDGNNIINENANTITIGASGDTVTLASGASQSGFGRTGTVDWQTGSIKTATFTAANGEGYFANTSGGAFTMNLPAGTAGNIVSVVDYTNTFQTNALTITPNGSQKIGGVAASFTANTEGQSLTFVYVDDTEGWKNIQDSTTNATGETFITATGGTITTSGNYKIHSFTGPGTFTVCSISSAAANNEVSYIVVAGGAGGQTKSARATPPGSRYAQGGGGAGGFRESKSGVDCYSASPLEGATPITVTAQGYPITVGGGGTAPAVPSTDTKSGSGSNSVFSTITSAGGGGAGYNSVADPTSQPGDNGGSGGAGGRCNSVGSGNTPPVSPPQGSDGGLSTSSADTSGGGGGGATAVGAAGTGSPSPRQNTGGAGGAGATTSITGSPVAYAGGGGGGAGFPAPGGGTFNPGAGGAGGGGAGGASPSNGTAGTANTGGGGGGAGGNGSAGTCTGGGGGSGIVIIRYKFQ